jgi:hypothetical protein
MKQIVKSLAMLALLGSYLAPSTETAAPAQADVVQAADLDEDADAALDELGSDEDEPSGQEVASAPQSAPACSAAEAKMMLDFLDRASALAARGDMKGVLRETQALEGRLSASCKLALQAAQQQQQAQVQAQPGWNAGRSGWSAGTQGGSAPQVWDHGNGTYSTTDVSCGPSGCVH